MAKTDQKKTGKLEDLRTKSDDQLAEHATDYEKCAELNSALIESKERKHAAELEWMELAEQLEGAG